MVQIFTEYLYIQIQFWQKYSEIDSSSNFILPFWRCENRTLRFEMGNCLDESCKFFVKTVLNVKVNDRKIRKIPDNWLLSERFVPLLLKFLLRCSPIIVETKKATIVA